MQHIEGVLPGNRTALLAAAAELVEADGRERPDQRKAGGEREQQRQDVVAERQPRQQKSDDWIEQAEEYRVARHGREVGEAPSERVFEVSQTDLADRWPGADRIRAHQDM